MVFPQCEQLPIISHYTSIYDIQRIITEGRPRQYVPFLIIIPITTGRHTLYPGDDGLFEKYLAVGKEHRSVSEEAYKKFTFTSLHVPKNLESRGVLDAELLPNYHYRYSILLASSK